MQHFIPGSANGSSVSAFLNPWRTFSVSRMELEKMATVVAAGEEEIESDEAQEVAVDFRSRAVEEANIQSDSSEEELFSCEGVDEGFLEDGEPHADPEGRSYLHVLSVEEVEMVLEKTRANDVQVISVRDLCEWADHLVIASGHSGRHLRGIADAICFEVKRRSINVGDNVYPTVEGRESEEWMVVDCGSIVVHVFRDDIRGEYNLEEMWRKRRPTNIKDIGL